MPPDLKNKVFDSLWQRRRAAPARGTLALFSTAATSLKAKKFCRVRVDGDRLVYRYSTGSLVTTGAEKYMPPPEDMREEMRDEYCFLTQPEPGDTVVDIGAGLGYSVEMFASLVGPGGRVVGVEAHPEALACGRAMLELNGVDNAEIVHAAVAGEPGVVRITTHDNWVDNTIVSSQEEGDVEVQAITLDALFERESLDDVALLKMNIEGAEGPALAGMREAIKACRAVAISCHDFLSDRTGDDSFRTRDAVLAFLAEHGFETTMRTDHPNAWTANNVYGRMS